MWPNDLGVTLVGGNCNLAGTLNVDLKYKCQNQNKQ